MTVKTVLSDKEQLKYILINALEKGNGGASLKEIMMDLEKGLPKIISEQYLLEKI